MIWEVFSSHACATLSPSLTLAHSTSTNPPDAWCFAIAPWHLRWPPQLRVHSDTSARRRHCRRALEMMLESAFYESYLRKICGHIMPAIDAHSSRFDLLISLTPELGQRTAKAVVRANTLLVVHYRGACNAKSLEKKPKKHLPLRYTQFFSTVLHCSGGGDL